MPGILATISVEDPGSCPVVSEFDGSEVKNVRWAVDGDGEPVGEVEVESEDGDAETSEGFSKIFETEDGNGETYRFNRGSGCICEGIESLGVPVSDVRFRNGSMYLALHLGGVERLRDVLRKISDDIGEDNVSVKSVVRSGSGGEDADPRVVDMGCLTDRQREVVQTAHSMGYFDSPRRATGEEVAEEMGIAISTFSEHLSSAEKKVFDELVP